MESSPATALTITTGQQTTESSGDPPIGAQATIPNWAESSSQLGFCKQPQCPLYNLFTGAWGRSGQGACEEWHVERIYLVCQFPSPAKGPQAEICTPSFATGCPALALALTSGT